MAITVQNGVNELTSELAGKSVSAIRSMLSQALNIDPEAVAYVNGHAVTPETPVQDGATLEFIKASGTKGND